jgi:Bacterial PH domain
VSAREVVRGLVIPGVEETLPPGERVLWTGRPLAGAVTRHVFHIRALALYFAAVLGLRIVSVGGTVASQALALAAYAACAAAALGLFALVGRWVARSTVYAITDRRVVLRIGLAMPTTLNIPLALVEGADLREFGDGSGEIALSLGGTDRFAYFLLWPHARPWQLKHPQPMLRGLADPKAVGALLAAAAAAHGAIASAPPAVSAGAGALRPELRPAAAPRQLAGR